MRTWVVWMIKHRMAWLLKVMAVLLYPVYVLAYCGWAWGDVQSDIDDIDKRNSQNDRHS